MNKMSTGNTFREKLLELFSKNTYQYVYVSLGSKINEENVTFSYPISNLSLISNAEFQMVPMFIRQQPETNNILCIIIDDFHDKTLAQINKLILNKITQNHNNISILVLDDNILLTTFKYHLLLLLNTLLKYNISPTHFMFTNFICFKHPNQLQLNFESKLPEVIQKSFDTISDGYYQFCYYQWFNYAYYTYNYIYCYKNYNMQRLMSIQHLHSLIKSCIKNDYLNNTNCEIITNCAKTLNKQTDKKWELFVNNCINFVEVL